MHVENIHIQIEKSMKEISNHTYNNALVCPAVSKMLENI